MKSRAKIKVLALIIAKKRENSIKYTLRVGNETAFQHTIVYSELLAAHDARSSGLT